MWLDSLGLFTLTYYNGVHAFVYIQLSHWQGSEDLWESLVVGPAKSAVDYIAIPYASVYVDNTYNTDHLHMYSHTVTVIVIILLFRLLILEWHVM